MKIRQGDTEIIHDRVARCEDIDELKEILDKDSSYYQDWKKYINAVVEVNKLTYEKLGLLCYSSKNTAKRWCLQGKMPQNREAFIKVAIGLGLSLEESNNLLQRYGKYPKLNPKSIEDAILIFVINHPHYERNPYEYYQHIKNTCMEHMKNKKRNKNESLTNAVMNTQYFQDEIISKHTIDEIETFIISHSDVFEKTYLELLQYLDMFIMSKNSNIHEFIQYKELNPTFEKLLSVLKSKGEVPNRMKLIALGIHLNMDLEQLNKMLELAKMEPVCARDKVECAVIYAVESANLNNPGLAYENALFLKNYTQNEEIQRKCNYIIKEYMNTKTYEFIMDNNMENEISEYLKWVLKEMEMDTEELYGLL